VESPAPQTFFTWQQSRRWLLFVLLIAFVIRLAAAGYWQQRAATEGRLFRLGDSHSYWTLAYQIGHGLPYQYESPESRIFRAPLYPLVLSPWTRWANPETGVWWARVFGCLLGTVVVAEVAWLALRLGGNAAAVLAGAIAAIYPAAIGMSIIVLSEAIFMPLMLAHLLMWQSAWQAENTYKRWGIAFLAGGVAGAAVLARPSWLLFIPFTWGLGLLTGGLSAWRRWMVAARKDRGQRTDGKREKQGLFYEIATNASQHSQLAIGSLLGLCLVMSPWWVRNAAVTGKFIPTTLQVGPSLLDGLHAGASGASDEDMAFMQPILAQQLEQDRQQTGPLDSTLEYRVNARAQRAATDWAQQHPGEALALAGRKFVRIWTLWPNGGEINSTAMRLALSISSFAVLLLAIGFSWWYWDNIRWVYGILWVPSLYFTLLHMVFVGSVRYREPALIVLVAVAGCALARCLRLSGDGRTVSSLADRVTGIASASTARIDR